jgi:hypothetical protein
VLHCLPDLHIKQFDVVVASENYVSLRYSAQGTHTGAPHADIEPTGNKADWTAQGSFFMTDHHKIAHWYKDWDKMQMWGKVRAVFLCRKFERGLTAAQLGWVKPKDAEFA